MNLIYFPFRRCMIEFCGIDGREIKYLHSTCIVSLFLVDNGYRLLFLFLSDLRSAAFALHLATSTLGMSCNFNSFWRCGLRPPE